METYKAAFIDHIRSELDDRGDGAEAEFLGRLTPQEQSAYRGLLPMAWITPEFGARLLEAAAPVLYGDNPNPVFELARQQAHHDMNGVYKLLLKIATVEMVISRAAKLFGTYHRRGTAEVHRAPGESRGEFVVHDYPELPQTIRNSVGGFITGLLELTGARDIRVRTDESDAQHWRWEITWR